MPYARDFSVLQDMDGYYVENEFGEIVAKGFASDTEARAWINQYIDNWEPPDPPGFEGGFADNH